MDIAGLSEATLETFIGQGWLHSCLDIYKLDEHKDEIIALDGFGQKSWDNLWASIQRSRNTTFEQYVVAMDIPMIGRTASRTLAKAFHGSIEEFRQAILEGFDFSTLPDFGEAMDKSIHSWFLNLEFGGSNSNPFEDLRQYVRIAPPDKESEAPTDNPPLLG